VREIIIFNGNSFLLCLGVSVHYHLKNSENKRHNILFTGKSKNPINYKISICPLNNIIYIILE